jgi:DHA1 family tetracycline resistance protein-like MFS transporter
MIDPRHAKRGLALVFSIVLLDMMGIAIIMPVMPAFLKELTGADPSAAAIEGGWLFLVYSVMQFVFGTVIGNLSDRFGRRPVLLASVLTFAIDNLICALSTHYWMLFVGRILAGISGASYATASAYVADLSTEENRARNFGLIGMAFGVGFTFGPVVGGLLGEFGPRVPFYGAALISFVSFVMATMFLPETLDRSLRRAFDWRRANPLGALRQMRRYKGIGWIASVMFLYWLAHAVYPAVWPYVCAYRYGWSESEIGLSLGVFGIMSAAMMGFGLPRLVKTLGEWRTAIIGLMFCAIALVGYGLASQGWMIFVIIVFGSLEAVTDAPMRSIASAYADPSAQGELQGALTSLSSITSIVGPLIFPLIFSSFSGPSASFEFPGMPYLVASGLVVIGLVVFAARVPRLRLAASATVH